MAHPARVQMAHRATVPTSRLYRAAELLVLVATLLTVGYAVLVYGAPA